MGYDRIILDENQELIMSRDNTKKYDNNATVVKTLDGFIVGRVPKQFTKSCRVMMDTVDILSINLSVSFIKLNGTEVREKTGKRYWEDQPEIRVDFLTEKKSQKKCGKGFFVFPDDGKEYNLLRWRRRLKMKLRSLVLNEETMLALATSSETKMTN